MRLKADLIQHFGKVGSHYYNITRGIDPRGVNPNRIRKSVGAEKSFFPDLGDRQRMVTELGVIAAMVEQRLHSRQGVTITLKLKYADYQQITRNRTVRHPFSTTAEIFQVAVDLFNAALDPERAVRLFGDYNCRVLRGNPLH
ncbi:MAG TPA: DNA polymerase IV, partial [Stenomitos sp.]